MAASDMRPRILPSSHFGGATLPETITQVALHELAGGVAGQIRVKRHLARDLVAGEPFAREGDDAGGIEVVAGAQLHGGVDALTPLVVGYAEDGHVLHGGGTGKRILD